MGKFGNAVGKKYWRCYAKTNTMQFNIQHVFDKQKENFDHFNELKSSLEHLSQDFKYLPGQKNRWCINLRGCLNSNKYGTFKMLLQSRKRLFIEFLATDRFFIHMDYVFFLVIQTLLYSDWFYLNVIHTSTLFKFRCLFNSLSFVNLMQLLFYSVSVP